MDESTKFFYELTPHTILDAVEEIGVRCTGRALALNSMENRVYEVEVEVDDPQTFQSRFDAYRVVKFYRPGRWSREQILEEHEFLFELAANDIPVVCPIRFSDGSSLRELANKEIYYAVFPKVGGRNLDELNREQLQAVGRLLARMHNVGASHGAKQRLALTTKTYGEESLELLLRSEHFPSELHESFSHLVRSLCTITESLLRDFPSQRVHGDFHVGNVLWVDERCFVVDFDDMVVAPPVQDIWLIQPGRDSYALEQRDVLLEAYETLRNFDRSSLVLIEPLRALRIIRFSAWIAQRWSDPAFPRVFHEFGTPKYWREQIGALQEQLQILHGAEL
ncbi:MAG: serine/threonine protein kinase [Bdellovibrionales bacterium]|nr:serine/threonine protein kinase [Bdellovibrionales bacterium]